MNTSKQSLKLREDGPANLPAIAATPMEMIGQALAGGATMEVLAGLMALQERWEKNQGRKAFDEAIAAAKAEIPVIRKNRKVDFSTAKGRTSYDHEDLPEIAKTVDPILSAHGLSYRFRARQEGKKVFVTCILSHRDGHSEENELSADNDETGNKNSIQAVGSTTTYLQRYTLKLALGLAAAKDDDARASAPPAKITPDQLDELISLADTASADKSRVCSWLKVESFADIPASQFNKAKSALIAAAKAKKEGAS